MVIVKSKRMPKLNYKIGQEEIPKTKEEKDLGRGGDTGYTEPRAAHK